MRGNLGGVSADHGDFAPGAARGTRTGTGASGFALGAGPLDMGRGGSRGDCHEGYLMRVGSRVHRCPGGRAAAQCGCVLWGRNAFIGDGSDTGRDTLVHWSRLL